MSGKETKPVTIAPRYRIGNVVEYRENGFAKITSIHAKTEWNKAGNAAVVKIEYWFGNCSAEENEIKRVVSEL